MIRALAGTALALGALVSIVRRKRPEGTFEAVQRTWRMVIPDDKDTKQLLAVGKLFFGRIFHVTPGAIELFSFKKEKQYETSKAYHDHAIKVIKTVSVAVGMLDDLDKLVPILQDLGASHKKYGVVPDHYNLVGAALIWTLETGLGDAWTPPVKDAWLEVWGIIQKTMIDAANY